MQSSIMEHAITTQEYMETVKSIEIDEESNVKYAKQNAQTNKQTKKTYLDHSAKLVNILYQSSKCIMEKEKDNKKRIYEVPNNNTIKRNNYNNRKWRTSRKLYLGR